MQHEVLETVDLQKDRKIRGGERHKTERKTGPTVIIPVRRRGAEEVTEFMVVGVEEAGFFFFQVKLAENWY